MQMTEDRRSQSRRIAKYYYRAEIRLVGVPVHEVKLKNLSSKGASLLFHNNSSLLKHMQIGQDLKVKFFLEDRSKPSKMFQAKVRHITEVQEGRFKVYYLAGLSIL